MLRFAWTIGSVETTTEFRLEPGKDGGTRLTISYTNVPTHEELAAGDADGAILWTWWLIPVSALADYLDGREVGPRVDFDATKGDEMRTTVAIDAPPDEVYPFLVEPDKLDQWIGMNSRVDARVGGEIEIHEGQGAAKIFELEPGRRLTVGWDDRPGVAVRWELEESEGKTHLTLVHSGFDDENPMDIGGVGRLDARARPAQATDRDRLRPPPRALPRRGAGVRPDASAPRADLLTGACRPRG